MRYTWEMETRSRYLHTYIFFPFSILRHPAHAFCDLSCQVLHLPGHSMGSIGLLNRRDGILVSGDTLYQTDSELIDWYPGSSVRHMYRSVERIRGLYLDLVLPGHNAEITSGESIKSHCERHLEMASKMKRRLLLKMLSRLRARTILEVNHRLRPLPEFIRVMMQH